MSRIVALVTRWRKAGAFGRTGPRACEVRVGKESGKFVLRIEQDDKKMALIIDTENMTRLTEAILENVDK